MDIVATILVELGKCVVPSACGCLDRHRKLKQDVDELMRRVRDLNSRKADIETQKNAEDLSKKLLRKQVEDWLQDVQKINEEMKVIEEKAKKVSYFHRASLGKLVREKTEEVERISLRGCFPEGLVIDRPPVIGIALPTEPMVGQVDVKEEIWGCLRDNEVGIIGVYGTGGVGKTTIMRHIHNELLKEARFDKVIWITVSQSLNVVKLQGDIAGEMNCTSLREDWDELHRAATLMDIMKTVKYVLILDDVWEKFTLQSVGIPKPTTENGCKIVITSRSRDVCRDLHCDKMVKVQPLSDQESMNLFLEKVGQNIPKNPNLKEILKLLVDECAGLPLAIVVTAGSMKEVEDIHEWRNALRLLRRCVVGTSGGSRDDEIFNRLKFSYDRLPNSNIQNCFLYCSLYPEDWEINRAGVIEDWICEGLIDESGSRQEMHDEERTILNKLENNCLVEKGRAEGCVKMHDVVRSMALRIKSIGPSKFMVKAGLGLMEIPEENEWTEDLEKVSLMRNYISDIPENISPKCSMLSTLILEGNRGLRQISECFFANMPLLKLLNLSDTAIEVLPNSICNLKNLTAMILRGCWLLKCMPSLSELKALKKLDLRKAGLLVVPEGIEMLVNLQYLDLYCENLKELPTGKISNLSRLQCLCRKVLSNEEILRGEAATLKKLKNFEAGFNDLKDFNCFVSKSKPFLKGLNHYVLLVGKTYVGDRMFKGFQSFDYDYCVKMVILVKCKIGGEDELVLPDDLQDLCIFNCNITVADISVFLKNATQLERYSLYLCEIKCVVFLSSSSSFTVMNSLKELDLGELPSLCDIVKVEKTTVSPHIFSNLKLLNVYLCPKLSKLFPCELLQAQGLRNLEEICVRECKEMEEIIGWEEEKRNQTTTAIFTLPNLRRLNLVNLKALKRICPERGVMVCDSLNSITIKNCEKLKRIPLQFVHKEQQTPHPALPNIIVYPEGWWESLEWDNPNAKNAFRPLVRDVRYTEDHASFQTNLSRVRNELLDEIIIEEIITEKTLLKTLRGETKLKMRLL